VDQPLHLVFLVDDDPSFRRSAERLLRLSGYVVESFSSARDFLENNQPDVRNEPACLVTDLRMPGMNGLDFQHELTLAGWRIPVIFVTGHGDVSGSVRAMKAGASEFLMKPFNQDDFLGAVADALKCDQARRERQAANSGLQHRYQSLTQREREVMQFVVSGMLNKQIAATLEVAEKTIKFHRAHIMEKMQAGSIAALVKMALDLAVIKPG
jgi:FixJ family two-component response regulator